MLIPQVKDLGSDLRVWPRSLAVFPLPFLWRTWPCRVVHVTYVAHDLGLRDLYGQTTPALLGENLFVVVFFFTLYFLG